ncbi:MAG: hypothetical protein R2862_05965 [Thermoanaerobaculia bacterium]
MLFLAGLSGASSAPVVAALPVLYFLAIWYRTAGRGSSPSSIPTRIHWAWFPGDAVAHRRGFGRRHGPDPGTASRSSTSCRTRSRISSTRSSPRSSD